jgi:calcineurin-like phosphoesterase family protein
MHLYWSDLHVGHQNIIKHCQRPFGNVGEMNTLIANSWNMAFRREDAEDFIVWNLGDLCLRMKDAEYILDAFYIDKYREFNRLIWGNHDDGRTRYEKYFSRIYGTHSTWQNNHTIVEDYADNRKWRILLSHTPQEHLVGCHLNIYGHHHNNWLWHPELIPEWVKRNPDKYINVGVELIGYQPRSLEELLYMRRNLHLQLL